MSYLDDSTFKTIVTHTPLISIDLVIEDPAGNILLGLRKNRPAQTCWFVPGGRIRKNERLDDAFRRLVMEEIGFEAERVQATLLGVYEHLYDDSVFGDAPSTHYIVLAYHIKIDAASTRLPWEQHAEYRWWPKAEMASSDSVHFNSRVYLSALPSGKDSGSK